MIENHEIIIENFNSEETVNYPVLIIKGHIKNKAKSHCQADKIYILKPTESFINCAFNVFDNKFKVLAELKLGENIITLNYCCSNTTIRINYVPRQTKYSVLPLYIICQGHDGKFQAPETHRNDIESASKKISLCSKLLQSFFAEKLYENKLGRKTFKLEECKIFHSKLNYLQARELTQENLWSTLGREILNSDIGSEETKYLGFLSCTKYCGENYQENFLHEDIVKLTQAYVALGGGGLALFGTACLFTWPEELSQVVECFENCLLIDKKQFMDDSNYRGTFGGCFSTTLGSVLHELCHTFDLGHTESGIMGRGFDDIYNDFIIQKTELETNASKTFQNNIKENLNLGSQFEGLTEKKNCFAFKNFYSKNRNNTFGTRSCLILLAYHKWFNDFENSKNKIIKFDSTTKVLSSLSGLRVIELRGEEDGMVLKEWVFDGRILKYSFQIPKDDLDTLKRRSVMLVVEDNVGNILKQVVNI